MPEPRRVSHLYGYRAWRVHDGLLYSTRGPMFRWLAWPTDAPQRATCYRNFLLIGIHGAPVEGCACGLYAWSQPFGTADGTRHPLVADPYGPHVRGVVSLLGRVIVHEYGYRAQAARPVAVEYSEHAEAVARNYGLVILESLADWTQHD
jgi:hypothetical protein